MVHFLQEIYEQQKTNIGTENTFLMKKKSGRNDLSHKVTLKPWKQSLPYVPVIKQSTNTIKQSTRYTIIALPTGCNISTFSSGRKPIKYFSN